MMLDLTTCPPTPPSPSPGANAAPAGGESSKFKTFMGRAPAIGILKSKFLTVLGNSNELLNGISNKLALSISSSESEYCDDDEEDLPKYDETIDYTTIDYESRRLKSRRAHEEIVSGRYRYPSLIPKPRLENIRPAVRPVSPSSTSSSSSSSSLSRSWEQNANNNAERNSYVSSTTRSNSIESRHSGGYGRPGRAIAGARRSDLDIQKDLIRINDLLNAPQIDVQPPPEKEQNLQTPNRFAHTNDPKRTESIKIPISTSANSMWMPSRSRASNSSTLTSLRDDPELLAAASPSVDSTEWRSFIRSESQNSVPSWASSISLDCRTGEEPVKEFMKRFTEALFTTLHGGITSIDLELKAEFNEMVRMEIGRQWFTRFLIEQKSKCRLVDETTFHALVQYMTIVLFECGECQDYAPAAIIMSLCFVFYREIEVPGCDPYREYLFIYLRQQPIWQTIRFWNAAFFDGVQIEHEHRLASKRKRAERSRKNKEAEDNVIMEQVEKSSSSSSNHVNQQPLANECTLQQQQQQQQQPQQCTNVNACKDQNRIAAHSENQVSERDCVSESRMRESIGFRILGTFTSNMHSLGVPQEMCLEFLKKQSTSLNLPKNKIKIVRDSINRMYQETDQWGAKDV